MRWDLFILFILRKLASLTNYRCHEGECLGYPGAFTVASQPLDRAKEGHSTETTRIGGRYARNTCEQACYPHDSTDRNANVDLIHIAGLSAKCVDEVIW